MDNLIGGRKQQTHRIPVAKDRPNPYLKYSPLRVGVAVPSEPLYRYQTNPFSFYAYKYALPLMMVFSYFLVMGFNLVSTRGAPVFFMSFLHADLVNFINGGSVYLYKYNDLQAVFVSPVQIAAAALLVPVLFFISAPLAHVIICEEGLFIRTGLKRRVFVPWKYLRSYHQSRMARPWGLVFTYYTANKRHVRVYAVASLETEHTAIEMLNYIRKVRRQEGPEAVKI